MRCLSCGHENREDASFCSRCAHSLVAELTCSSCGRENPATESFCDGCGRPVGETATAARTPTPTPAPALPASFASGRYEVQRLIGEGATKRVYLAYDNRLGRDVAFALIKSEGLTEEGIARVQREGQAMGQLGDHQHIVTAYDAGEEAGQHYIVMEYMAGGDLEALLHSKDGDGLQLEDALRIGDEIAQALEHAHGQGIIHRDLKPGNIWLTDDRTAKLGDFGFVLAADRSRLTQAGMMIGTPYCMPPEQALGAEVTPASDLYSLGCVLYEMVAGRPPFPGDDPTAVISQHINNAPVAPSWHSDHCPPDLEELILRLLAKAPDDRPQSAAEVREALERVDPTERSASHEQGNVLDRLARGVFVGREKELDGLRKAFDEAFAGHGSIVMLVGEPGIGKTRSAQELETYARMRGAQVLWGANHEAAGAPAYWPWVQVGRTYGSTHAVAETAAAMEGGGADLVKIFPELRQLAANFQEPEPATDPESAQFRLFDAYTRFVQAMSEGTPLLIALDDLHWTDKGSLLLLQHLARELSRMRVLIVCTYRDTDLVRTHPLSEALATLNRESGFQRIVLRGLSREECSNYIRTAANVQPAHSVLDKIFEETEGNPFFLSEVVNLMAQEGTLTKDSISDIAIPDGVREALGRRLNRISEEGNELLKIAAVAGSEFTYDTLSLLEEHDEDELLRLIEEALEARVIEEMEQPGRYRFTHAQMHDTLLDELSTTRRVRLHGRIGEALEKRYGDRADERSAGLAGHFVEAAMLTPRHAEKAVRYSKLAAAQSEAQAAWDVAARHYEHCLTLVSEAEDNLGEDEAALLLALGRCQSNGATWRPAWRSLMRAINLYRERRDPVGMAKATLVALRQALPRQYPRLRADALEALGQEDPHLRARLLVPTGLAAPAVPSGDRPWMLEENVRLDVQHAGELARAHGFADVEAAVADYHTHRALLELQLDDMPELAKAAFRAYEPLHDYYNALHLLEDVVVTYAMLGRLDDARDADQDAMEYAKSARVGRWEQYGIHIRASLAFLRCELDRFESVLAEGPRSNPATQLLRARRAGLLGDGDEALALAEAARAAELPEAVVGADGALARIYFERGQEDDARERLHAWAEGLPALYPVYGEANALAEVDASLPALGEEAVVRGVYEQSTRWHQFRAARGVGLDPIRGSLALRLGLVDEAEQHYRTGLEWAERERCPVEAGRCLQGLAEVAERRGNTAEALPLLDRAAALFQEHGAKLYLGRVIATKVKLQGIVSGEIKTSIDAVFVTVQAQQPDLRSHAAPDGTVTILFSDIESHTAINERLGDQRWMELLREHNALVREQIQSHEGYEVKTEGDGFMVAFGSARKAVQCAVAMQRAFAKRNDDADEPVLVRIGLHTGEPVKENNDFYGTQVTQAARIGNEANGGEILVSALLKQLTEAGGDIAFSDGRDVELKGLGTHQVFGVAWEQG